MSLSKTGFAVMTCMAIQCGMQLFTRGEGADEKVRDRITAQAAQQPAPASIPSAPAPAPAPAAKPARRPMANPFDFLLNPGAAA